MVKANLISFMLLLPAASLAFMGVPLSHPRCMMKPLSVMNNPTMELSGKYFQIEEMEDKERCTTEVLLNSDATVSLLQTDGPLHKDASGSWKILPDGSFEMTLTRVYEAGQPKSPNEPTKLGTFQFATTRVFRGTMAHVGAKTSMEGGIIDSSEGDEKDVGFFEMIDSTTEGMDDWQPMGRSAASP